MVESPLVSVIIPTYSRPTNLCRAIDSVLNQTYRPIEIIVVDDNGVGTEFQIQTESVLKKYIELEQIVYVKHDVNKNGSAARNTGFRISNGEYINFLDDDDVLIPSKIEIQVSCLINSDDKIGAAFCNTIVEDNGCMHYVKNLKDGNVVQELLLNEVQFNTSTILFKRECLETLNGWDESFFRHQDWELMVRFFSKYEIKLVAPDDYLIKKYVSSNIVTKNPLKSIEFKEFFIDKMSSYLDAMPLKNEILFKQYDILVYHLFKYGFRKQALKYVDKTYSFKKPSVSIRLKNIARYILSFPRGLKYK